MKKIKNPEKIVIRKKLAKLAILIQECAKWGLKPSEIIDNVDKVNKE